MAWKLTGGWCTIIIFGTPSCSKLKRGDDWTLRVTVAVEFMARRLELNWNNNIFKLQVTLALPLDDNIACTQKGWLQQAPVHQVREPTTSIISPCGRCQSTKLDTFFVWGTAPNVSVIVEAAVERQIIRYILHMHLGVNLTFDRHRAPVPGGHQMRSKYMVSCKLRPQWVVWVKKRSKMQRRQ
jgi:hypothetical protein